MFRRIRETYRLISYREAPGVYPDLPHEEKPSFVPVTKYSAKIGELLEIALFSVVVGLGTAYVDKAICPGHTALSLKGVSGIFFVFFSIVFYRLLHSINSKLFFGLSIGKRLSPYFGHKIEHSFRALKG